MALSRRDVLKIGGLGLVGTAGLGGVGSVPFGGTLLAREASELDPRDLPRPFAARFHRPPVLKPTHWEYDEAGRLFRQHFHLTARPTTAHILPRHRTRMWGYNGMVPGPTIEVDRGVESVVRVRNALPAHHPLFRHPFALSTHLHGSASLPHYDGYADDLTPPGNFKDYRYPNVQAARTIWYHDHAVHHTAMNVYTGLAAQYHIHDRQERRLLPQGRFDVPLTVADALFDGNGQLRYDDDSHSGLYGDVILVNGRPWPTLRVQRRVYRFRVLVASVSRSFRFTLSTGDPVHVVATDGGLMPRSQSVMRWRQGAGERYEVLVDFRRYRPGQRIVLQNLSNDNNRDYAHTDKVMAFDVMADTGAGEVDRSDPTWNRIPGRLVESEPMRLTAARAKATRHLEMERHGGLWTINRETWDDVSDSGFEALLATPDVGDVEVWNIKNTSGGWFHPTHIHLVDFRVLSRNGRPPEAYERGPKDTVYIGENESVRVVARFGDPRRPETHGKYMVHCHNLVHEDHDMMHQFAVGWRPGEVDDCDPIHTAPSKHDDLPRLAAVAPSAPRDLEVTRGRRRVTLTWREPREDGDADVTHYRIRGWARGGRRVDVVVRGRRRHVVRGLTPGKAYRFTVAAINRAGAGPQSRRSARVVPLPRHRGNRKRRPAASGGR